ncbi:MAG TPA: vitamin K epoxide reductase family protein [Acidobacteriaceae bacterium]|nr:vitamin K epoxide reductase family protein [Acidobacteriaceae bacterium]
MKYVIALLAVAGIVVSSMALHIHFMDPSQAPPCAVTAKWDCGEVNHGKYSAFPPYSLEKDYDINGQFHPTGLHIPVALVGILGYLLILIAALMGRMRIVLELSRIGFFCAAFLSYIEAYIITKWCIYCVWSQFIILTILLLSIVTLLLRRRRRAESMVAVLMAED